MIHNHRPSPCPVCHLSDGFHGRDIHNAVTVSKYLTWKADEEPRWLRRGLAGRGPAG